MTQPMILAVGAAGKNAGLVVPELRKRGAVVRGLVRDARQSGDVRQHGASEVVVGDLRDPASLATAFEGVDGVFYIAPAFMPDEAEVGTALVAAAQRAGVRRFVFSSVIHPILEALENHIAKAPVEAAILESGMEYAFLHPAIFFQNIGTNLKEVRTTGVFAEPWSTTTPFSRVDYRDVAEVAAIALTEERLNYGTYELCAEGTHTREDMAAIMSEVLGQTIRPEQAHPNLPDNEQSAGLRRMFGWYDRHALLGNALTLRAILGREPRTLRAFIEELAAA